MEQKQCGNCRFRGRDPLRPPLQDRRIPVIFTVKIDTGTKVIIALMVGIIAFFAFVAWINKRPPTVYQFELSEIADGVYAYRETAVSSIPAENYTMATVCDKNGNIFTIRGSVKVVNQNGCPPYAVWEDSNIVNGDMITIYAPANTVEYLGAVSIGRR